MGILLFVAIQNNVFSQNEYNITVPGFKQKLNDWMSWPVSVELVMRSWCQRRRKSMLKNMLLSCSSRWQCIVKIWSSYVIWKEINVVFTIRFTLKKRWRCCDMTALAYSIGLVFAKDVLCSDCYLNEMLSIYLV